jgi:hypothetical protein
MFTRSLFKTMKFFQFFRVSQAFFCLYSILDGDELYLNYVTVEDSKEIVWWFNTVFITLFHLVFAVIAMNIFIAIFTTTYEIMQVSIFHYIITVEYILSSKKKCNVPVDGIRSRDLSRCKPPLYQLKGDIY